MVVIVAAGLAIVAAGLFWLHLAVGASAAALSALVSGAAYVAVFSINITPQPVLSVIFSAIIWEILMLGALAAPQGIAAWLAFRE